MRGSCHAPVGGGELIALLAAERDKREVQRERPERGPAAVLGTGQRTERGAGHVGEGHRTVDERDLGGKSPAVAVEAMCLFDESAGVNEVVDDP